MTQEQVVDDEKRETPEGPHIMLDLDGDRAIFPAYPDANQFLLTKHINSLSVPGFPSINAVTVLLTDQVLPEERDRLEAYLLKHGRIENYAQLLYDALSDCWEGKTMLPLAPPSS